MSSTNQIGIIMKSIGLLLFTMMLCFSCTNIFIWTLKDFEKINKVKKNKIEIIDFSVLSSADDTIVKKIKFEELTNLRGVYIDTSISYTMVLSKATQIQMLGLYNHTIDSALIDVLYSLGNLESLYFYHCKISNSVFGYEKKFPKIQQLTITHANSGDSSLYHLCSLMPELKELILSSNQLVEIDMKCLSELKKLNYINFTDNLLTDVPDLRVLPNLTRVSLRKNRLDKFPINIFDHSKDLKYRHLLLGFNNITEIPDEVIKFHKYYLLDIVENKLSRLSIQGLNEMKIRYLDY